MEVGKVEQSKWGWKHERKSVEEWKEIQGRNSEQRLLRTAQERFRTNKGVLKELSQMYFVQESRVGSGFKG